MPQPTWDLVFFDGTCGFCHRMVRFLILRDRRGALRFSPKNGTTYAATFTDAQRASFPESMVIKTADGRTLFRSASNIRLLRRLGGGWWVLGSLMWLVPAPLRNWGYDVVAHRRHRLYAKPDEACPMVPPELRGRFLA